MLTSFGRVFVFAWKNFIRNTWIGLATVLVLLLALLSVNILLTVNTLAARAIDLLEQKIDVSVYFVSGTSNDVVDQARMYMMSLPQTASVEVVEADRVLEIFRERHADDATIQSALDELGENPFGASMAIKAKQVEDYPFLMKALQNPQFSSAIESKNFEDHAGAIDRVHRIADTVRFFGYVLISVFILFSVLIIYNAIRVSVFTQREEIGVMRLVGASNSIVRWPLLLNGSFFALIALAICVGLLWGLFTFVDPYLRTFFDGSDPQLLAYIRTEGPKIVLVEAGVLFFLVFVSSWAAVGRYLKR